MPLKLLRGISCIETYLKALMKPGVIQDFLNLPGIAGIALMDRRSRPYFCGIDQSLNFQQKEALAQGILQVIETIPAGFESFEFQFTQQRVHIYKLDRGIILLVLTQENLVFSDYQKAIQNLTLALDEETVGAIAMMRQTAGNTLSSRDYRKPLASLELSSVRNSPPEPQPTPSRATLTDLLVALNHLSQFTSQYLGTHVIVNYWKTTRPSEEWLTQFQVDRSAHFSLDVPDHNLLHTLTQQEQEWTQDWVSAFMLRCARVIRDFPAIVEQKALNPHQKALLLGKR